MAVMTTRHESNTGRGLSPLVWRNCPINLFRETGNGIFFFDDFVGNSVATFASATPQNGYDTYQDTGVTIAPLATEVGGVLRIAGNDADNDEGSITTGGGAAGMLKISDTAGANLPVWFEARLRIESAADNGVSLFIGLAAEGLAGADTLVDNTGALADNDFVGFRTLAADGDSLDAVYNVASGAATEAVSGAQTLVADTWYNVGLYYDGTSVAWFVNGAEVTTPANRVLPAATNFPDAEELALLLATKVGSAAEVTVDLDWWAAAMQLEW